MIRLTSILLTKLHLVLAFTRILIILNVKLESIDKTGIG